MLAPDETVPRRPFTSVDLYERDVATLTSMLEDLRALVARWEAGIVGVVPHKRIAWRVHGLKRRAIICDPDKLRRLRTLHAVGFFAHRRSEVDIGPLDRANNRVVREFRNYPGILSYSSWELPGSNWANLILNDGAEATERWRGCAVHARAVEELSPTHYRNVRIHSGPLPGGLRGGHSIVIARTRYVDYSAAGRTWSAVRVLEGAGV